MKITLTQQDLRARLPVTPPEYRKYVRDLINLANRTAKATIRSRVGQVSELIHECPARDYEGWCTWYLSKYPKAIEQATERVLEMLELLRDAMDDIDPDTVRKWITELVLAKTYTGLRVQQAILEETARRLGETLRPSSPDDESRGIDGYLDGQAVSVKPVSYKNTAAAHIETIDASMIYYEKKNGTIVADLGEVER